MFKAMQLKGAARIIKSVALITALAITSNVSAGPEAGDRSPSTSETVAALAPLKVEGNLLVAKGKAVRLRGLDWGWWHLMGTRYSEADMQNVAKWGANVVRLSFSYGDVETDDVPAVWKEEGFKDLDDVLSWAKRNGIYIILDLHVVPGGQSDAPYCAGGHNLLWTDPTSQERFVSLWTEIARRYRDHPEVGAYELLNEPGSHQKTAELLRSIDQRAIEAIRTVDPDKIIVVGGDGGSQPGDLTDAMKFSDNNILYTFHWYIGAGGNEDWISTATQDQAISGDRDWTKLENTFTAPPGADHMGVLLRSSGNLGSAWFDDVDVDDASGNHLQSASFDQGANGFKPEANPDSMNFDQTVGHDGPGSLRLHGTTGHQDWAGWGGKHFKIQPGGQYRVSAWVKLDHATGGTYLGAAFFRIDTQLDRERFQKEIIPATQFARKFNVPVWVGEFGCDASNKDLQVEWVNACISLFEENGFHWTYWNDKETSSPDGMGLQAEHRDGSDYPVNPRLLAALRAGWSLNSSVIPHP